MKINFVNILDKLITNYFTRLLLFIMLYLWLFKDKGEIYLLIFVTIFYFSENIINLTKEFYLQRKFEKNKKRLIKIGDKIKINLKNLQIKEYFYASNTKINNNFKCITFAIMYNEKRLKYHVYIDKDLEAIKTNFRFQESTTLYINPLDYSDNYLDLSFLNLDREFLNNKL